MSCCDATWVGAKIEHCSSCCQSFSGTYSGDMHRVGLHHVFSGPDRRRCLTPAEMESIGMTLGKDGIWRSPSAEKKAELRDLRTAGTT